jgi:hypothetical protein
VKALDEICAEAVERIGRPIVDKLTFDSTGDFHALSDAMLWCRRNGYSVGQPQRVAPIGIVFGDAAISKWRNLGSDACNLDGAIISADYRKGPVAVLVMVYAMAVSK